MAEKWQYETQRVKDYMTQADLKPMDLVRLCGIAVSSAYRIDKSEPITDLDVLKAFGNPKIIHELKPLHGCEPVLGDHNVEPPTQQPRLQCKSGRRTGTHAER